jgi:hypothetical protein
MNKRDLDIASLTPEERLGLLEELWDSSPLRLRHFRSLLPSVPSSIAASTISTLRGQSAFPGRGS